MKKHLFYLSMSLILALFQRAVMARRVCLLRRQAVGRMKFW